MYLAQRVTRNTDSNYKPKEGRKSGSLTLCFRIWHGNIFPISQGQSFLNQILGKKYIGGKNLNTNFVFFRRKSRELLSFVFGPSSYLKYGFQLCAYRRRKNGCLTFCSQIRIRNIFSISLDQSSQNLIVGKKYVSGLFTSHNRFQNV